MALLLREAIGDTIRRTRTDRRRTLREVSREARVSLGYLSEVERGRKEPSSELLAAICEALSLPLPDLLGDVAAALRPAPAAPDVPAAGVDPALRSAVDEVFAPAAETAGSTDPADGATLSATGTAVPGGADDEDHRAAVRLVPRIVVPADGSTSRTVCSAA